MTAADDPLQTVVSSTGGLDSRDSQGDRRRECACIADGRDNYGLSRRLDKWRGNQLRRFLTGLLLHVDYDVGIQFRAGCEWRQTRTNRGAIALGPFESTRTAQHAYRRLRKNGCCTLRSGRPRSFVPKSRAVLESHMGVDRICTGTLDVIDCGCEVRGANRSVEKRGETGIPGQSQHMPINIADLLGLDVRRMHDCTEFQHFIRSRYADGTKTNKASGHNRKNATPLHSVILLVASLAHRQRAARHAGAAIAAPRIAETFGAEFSWLVYLARRYTLSLLPPRTGL